MLGRVMIVGLVAGGSLLWGGCGKDRGAPAAAPPGGPATGDVLDPAGSGDAGKVERACSDGLDNDSDGATDCQDSDCAAAAAYEARATFYEGIDTGNCGFGAIAQDAVPYGFIVAPNTAFYNGSATCGAFVEISSCGASAWGGGTNGCSREATITAMVTDQCPAASNSQWCGGDKVHFDLSPAAFAALAEPSCGVVGPLKWRFVERPGDDTLAVRNKDGVNAWWYAAFIDRHRYGITAVSFREAAAGSAWVPATRTDYNAWIATGSGGFQLPLSVRVTDIHGQVLEAADVITDLNDFSLFDTGKQFPAGRGGGTLSSFGL